MRAWSAVAAGAALTVAIVFQVVGDGVPSRGAGLARVVVDYGHSLTWVLLAAMFALMAVDRGRKAWVSSLGFAALASYGVFLAVLLLGDASAGR